MAEAAVHWVEREQRAGTAAVCGTEGLEMELCMQVKTLPLFCTEKNSEQRSSSASLTRLGFWGAPGSDHSGSRDNLKWLGLFLVLEGPVRSCLLATCGTCLQRQRQEAFCEFESNVVYRKRYYLKVENTCLMNLFSKELKNDLKGAVRTGVWLPEFRYTPGSDMCLSSQGHCSAGPAYSGN